MYKFQQKLKKLKDKIKKWEKEDFGNISIEKRVLESMLAEIQTIGMNSRYSVELQEERPDYA